ncbi:MAG: hypothetical protein RL283_969 [Actinomycetota bacterium]|jgi:enamine deaminase RidA (YjgF/YER057c/UK114 family)
MPGSGDPRAPRELRPPTVAAPAAAYAHGVLVPAGCDVVHTSGVVPTRPDGTVPADVGAQADVVWANLAAILGDAGMTLADAVSVTTYVVAPGDPAALRARLDAVMARRDAALGGRRAASTLVTVPALARPEWLVEIAVVAARPAGRP